MAATKADEEKYDEKWAQMTCSTPSWKADAKNGDHLWCKSSASGDQCYVANNACAGRGHRLKCSSCKIIVHTECARELLDKMGVLCRPSFQDAENESYRGKTNIQHHWVARKTPKGRCRTCSKNFGGKMCALLNEKVAMICSWCKEVCHNRDSCYDAKKANAEKCGLGAHSKLIVPHTWILKLQQESGGSFAVKPIPSASSAPLLVFINPKSGGNQGSKLLRTFQWLLNPRQVFDLTQGGPGFGLDLYRRVPNLRLLACGGDGTVGWILSVLDDMKGVASPPIAVLPLGTGNDLARALGWGGGYTDEPLSKILSNVENGKTVKLDRWLLDVSPNESAEKEGGKEGGRNCPPLTVVNNYFSLGVDAQIALEFHEAREAHPSKFNSRFRNKMFYGQAGGKDLIQRKWKDLSSHVTLECDGQDVTPKLKELKVHSILFLNIPSYGGGTKPWGGASGQFQAPRTDDGLIEVIGLTTYQLPLLQAGAHGSPVAQCKRARLVTSCTVPVQVDGEPCRLLPSVVQLGLLNTVNMIARTKRHGASTKKERSVEKSAIPVRLICLSNYEAEHHRKGALRGGAAPLGTVDIGCNTELSEVRAEINKLLEVQDSKAGGESKRMHWWFLDSCSGEKFFRIDEAQEHLFYALDVCDDDDTLFVAEEREPGTDPAEEDVVSRASESSSEREYEIPKVVIGEMPDTPEWEEPEEDYDPEEAGLDEEEDDVPRIYDDYDEEVEEEEEEDEEDYDEEDEEDENHLRLSPGGGQEKKLSISSFQIDESEMDIIAAAKMGNLNKVAELHNEGHSLEERDHEGRTALHHAAFIGNVEVVRYLAAYAPIQILDAQDDILFQTALHRAATRRDRVVCSILVSAGASVDIRDKHGHTALDLAELVGAKRLAAYLKSVAEPFIL